MSNPTTLPALNREQTADYSIADSSQYDKGEKGEIYHRENKMDALDEAEDEGAEVGVADYERSKQMEAIVSSNCFFSPLDLIS